MCLWAAATEVAPQAGKAQEEEEVDGVEEFENELDAMVVEDDAPSEEPPSPRRLRCVLLLYTAVGAECRRPYCCICTAEGADDCGAPL